MLIDFVLPIEHADKYTEVLYYLKKYVNHDILFADLLSILESDLDFSYNQAVTLVASIDFIRNSEPQEP